MITLTVTPDNGKPYQVTATSRDVLTWEKTTKGDKSFVDLIRNPNLVDFYKVAWIASWRQGLTAAKNQQEFEATCEVDGLDSEEEGDEEPDPTQSAASAEPSSDSPSEPASPRPSGRKRANAQS